MATQVQICNRTLHRIGQEKIASIEEDSKAAEYLREAWDMIRDEVLRDHTWNFAVRREQVAAEAAAPAWGFAYEYLQPGDCLRVVSIDDDPEIKYRVEGLSIFTDEGSPINLKYIGQVEDTTQWDAKFVNAFCWRLGQEVAWPLTASLKVVQMTANAYLQALSEAKTVDAQEDGGQDAGCGTWTDCRS
jgi:hypothetical protein